MADPASTPFKCILFEKRVRFRLPADCLEGQEAGIGIFLPTRVGGGTLRVTSEVPPGEAEAVLAQQYTAYQALYPALKAVRDLQG